MVEFFQALKDPDLVFLRYALILSLVASVPLGAVGTLVVVRRISYLAAAIAHSALGGIGVALYTNEALGWYWLSPMLGALLSAVLSAALVGWVSLRAREREDAAIGAIWVSGMAIGLLCIYNTISYYMIQILFPSYVIHLYMTFPFISKSYLSKNAKNVKFFNLKKNSKSYRFHTIISCCPNHFVIDLI